MSLQVLEKQITLITRTYEFAGRQFKFVPDSDLQEILDRDTVEDAVAEMTNEFPDKQHIVSSILSLPARKIFAILVHLKQAIAISQFLDRRFDDSQLPFHSLSNDFEVNRRFLDVQWHFLSPRLIRGSYEEFTSHLILPFLACDNAKARQGGYGNITKVEIHQSHQNFDGHLSDGENFVAALKVLVKDDHVSGEQLQREFERERLVLELLDRRGHPGIVPLLCSFKLGDTFGLLFPWAELDLERLFHLEQRNCPPGLRKPHVIYQAMKGVAEALETISSYVVNVDGGTVRYTGYHHDLKPANILIRGNKFMLADFGFGGVVFNPCGDSPGVNVLKSKYRGGSEGYAPPETDPGGRDDDIDMFAVDLWAFGGIMLETLIYTVYDSHRLEYFRKERKTWLKRSSDDCFHDGHSLKSEVQDWMGTVERDYIQDVTVIKLLEVCKHLLNPVDPSQRREISLSARIGDAIHASSSTRSVLHRSEVELGLEATSSCHKAAARGELHAELVKSRSSHECRDRGGRIPFHWAVFSQSTVLLQKMILDLSPVPDMLYRIMKTQDYLGNTPLHIAAQLNSTDVIEMILAGSAVGDANGISKILLTQNIHGKTPLHFAVEATQDSNLECMLKYVQQQSFASEHTAIFHNLIFCKDKRGRTAFHSAAEQSYSNCYRTLLLAKPDPDFQKFMLRDCDDAGQSSLQLAREVGFQVLIDVYHDIMAKGHSDKLR